MPTEKPRFSITVSQDLLDKIEDFRFEKRIKSQNQAIVELISIGLNNIGLMPQTPAKPPLNASDARLLATFHAADKTAQGYALQLLENNPAQEKSRA